MLQNPRQKALNQSVQDATAASCSSYNEAYVIARQTFDLIEEYRTPPVPRAYEVLYSSIVSAESGIRSDIDDVVLRKGLLELSDIDRIYDEHFALSGNFRLQQDKTAHDLDMELGAVLDLVNKHLSSNQKFETVLDDASVGLVGNLTTAKLRRTVEALIAENKRARAESADLSRSLEASRDTIQTMKTNFLKAREEGLRDPLTGLRNRRYLDSQLPIEIDLARRDDLPLSFCMLDLDHFKQINDRFGHPIGDAVLKLLSGMINDNTKGRDVAARYGGEEFALILPQTSVSDAAQLADKIRQLLSEKRLVMTENRTAIGQVTVSIGVAGLRPGDDVDSLVSRADARLYEAKNAGRNRVLSDSP